MRIARFVPDTRNARLNFGRFGRGGSLNPKPQIASPGEPGTGSFGRGQTSRFSGHWCGVETTQVQTNARVAATLRWRGNSLQGGGCR